MWIWVIVIAVVIGAVIGLISSGGNLEEALKGGAGAGCVVGGCLIRIAIAAISIIVILWLFGLLFG